MTHEAKIRNISKYLEQTLMNAQMALERRMNVTIRNNIKQKLWNQKLEPK